MTLKYVVRVNQFGIYNCGAAIFSNFQLKQADVQQAAGHCYPEPGYLAKYKDEIIAEFLEYMGDPCSAKIHPFPKKDWKGVIAHYHGVSIYYRIPFYMFHDNVKGDIVNAEHPFSDGASLLSYLYHNQEKYGCVVSRSHMADNIYHAPAGYHPGRVYILTPPSIHSFVPGAKLPAEVKKYLAQISEYPSIWKDDRKLLKELSK